MGKSNIHPKALNKSLKAGMDSLFDGYKKFLKGEGLDKENEYAQIFAGRTGQAMGGRFNRMGSGSLAVLFDVGVTAEPAGATGQVVNVGGDVGVEGNVGKGWGHSGDASLAEVTQAFVIAVPRDLITGGAVDVAQALHALASAPVQLMEPVDDEQDEEGGAS